MHRTEQIWHDYHTGLHRFIQNRVGDVTVADDILQDIFLRIHSRIDTLRDDRKMQSWIYHIARNSIIDHYRKHKVMVPLPETLTALEPEPTDSAQQEILDCLMPMIQLLPDHYREALMLSEINGYTQQTVAAKQNLSLSGAKSRIQRGRTMMKDMLLDCCRFEFDPRGRIVDYEERDADCGCDEC